MDPISIIGAVVTLAQVAAGIGRAISRLGQIGELPRKAYTLKNELSDLETLLIHVRDALEAESLALDTAPKSLAEVFEGTKKRLLALAQALERIEEVVSKAPIKIVAHGTLWLRQEQIFQNLHYEVESIKASMNTILSASTVLALRKIAVSTPRSEEFNHAIQETNGNYMALSTLVNQQHEDLSGQISALGRILESYSPSLASSQSSLISEKKPEAQVVGATTTPPRQPCRSWCPCACHTKRKLNLTAPRIVQDALGRMFVRYTGMPLLKERCDFRGCRHLQTASATIEYWLPSWFASMNLRFCFSYMSRTGPELLLSTTRRVADDSQSITFAMKGDINGLKQLFLNGLAGPRDVSDSRGYTLMRWALYGGMHNYETVQFLIHEGALVDETSYENVWDFIMRGKCTETEQGQLRCITDGGRGDWMDEQNFPLIHRIIFGLSSKPLAAELEENPHTVDIVDAQNRTALDWATARVQLEHMEVLLKHEANPNNMDATGRTPVLHAVDSHDVRALQLILEAGGNPNPTYPKGLYRSSPLTAAGFAGMSELLKLLLDHEADPNACNPEGLTALHSVARTHNTECAELLLRYGADLNAMSTYGRTPLTTAIIHNNHEVLKLFTSRCWDYMRSPRFNVPEILPVIAEHADVETINILTPVEAEKISYDVSFKSLIANRKILEQRADYDEKLGEAFDELIIAARAGAEELRSPISVLESEFTLSARSSFHSELGSAILKLRSVDTGLSDIDGGEERDFCDSPLQEFYSPTSPITGEHFTSPIIPGTDRLDPANTSSPLSR